MTYVDGFIIPVRNENREAYRKLAEMAAPIFMEYGAIEVVENWGDDLINGHTTDFYRAVKAEDGENVVFSWIIWPSKEVRDAGNKAAMADKRFEDMPVTGIFDGKRMIFSGFSNLISKKAQGK